MSIIWNRICIIVALVGGITPLLLCQTVLVHSVRIELDHDKPFVTIMVNGKGPFRFVIDTGTSADAFVTPEFAEVLGLPAIGQSRLSDPSKQYVRSVPIVLIQSLEVAGFDFRDIKAKVPALGKGEGSYQGLLGFSHFRDYLLTLDFPNRELTLATGSLLPDGEHSVLSFRMPDGIPIVNLRIGGLPIDAQIDSGGDGLLLPDRLAARLKFADDPAEYGNDESLSTRFQIRAARLAPNVEVGDYFFKRPFVEIGGAFPLANFGSSPLQAFAVTFDQKNRLVRFKAGQKALSLSAPPTPINLLNGPSDLPPSLFPGHQEADGLAKALAQTRDLSGMAGIDNTALALSDYGPARRVRYDVPLPRRGRNKNLPVAENVLPAIIGRTLRLNQDVPLLRQPFCDLESLSMFTVGVKLNGVELRDRSQQV